MNYLSQEVEVGGTKYVVQAVDAYTQWHILQKLAKYGIAALVEQLVIAEKEGGDIKTAMIKVITAVITAMPEEDQEFCITSALAKTAVKDQPEMRAEVSLFTGKISEYVMLGIRAIKVQLGDFSCFQSLIPGSTAGAAEDKE